MLEEIEMKEKCLSLVVLLSLSLTLSAQTLFEEAQASQDKEKDYELNGYLRSTLFLGKMLERNLVDIKSGYGEFSLKLKVSKMSFGDAYTEVRYRRGLEFDKPISELNLREAYVSTYIGPFDFRIGHQIVVWGRADGINPTDNITPKNMLARSPDEDDRREGNFLVRSFINLQPLRLELIWVPFFRSSVIPTHLLPFPAGVTLGEPDFPDAGVKNGAIAAKVNLELASFDGSISYFNGYNPFPGINFRIIDSTLPVPETSIFLKSYRLYVFGADFSTIVAGSFGLRGEAAYKKPHRDYRRLAHIPNPELHYVFGLDKELSGNLNIILQYIGKYVFDYSEDIPLPEIWPLPPEYLLEYELALKNRIINSQKYEWSHSLSCRLGWSLLHETLNLELVGLINFISEEYLLRPKLAYDITDALIFTLGGELYSGPEDTLFDIIDSHLSSLFTELKISF